MENSNFRFAVNLITVSFLELILTKYYELVPLPHKVAVVPAGTCHGRREGLPSQASSPE